MRVREIKIRERERDREIKTLERERESELLPGITGHRARDLRGDLYPPPSI